MALIIADRVKETTTTQGIGTVTLGGSTFGGFQSFSSAIGEGNTTYYCIQPLVIKQKALYVLTVHFFLLFSFLILIFE